MVRVFDVNYPAKSLTAVVLACGVGRKTKKNGNL